MGFGHGRGNWVLEVVLLLQAKEIYALCENFMYTGLPPVPSCPCPCPCPCPLPLFLVSVMWDRMLMRYPIGMQYPTVMWHRMIMWHKRTCLGCYP